jgi:hypothetical protein
MNIVGDWINIDKFIFTEYDPTYVGNIDAEDIQTFEIFDVNGENYGKIVSNQHRLPYILREKGYVRGVYVAKSAKKVIKVIVE